jgi:hypothetical protein
MGIQSTLMVRFIATLDLPWQSGILAMRSRFEYLRSGSCCGLIWEDMALGEWGDGVS